MQNEIYLVQAEYIDKVRGTALVSPCGYTFDYEQAKRLCHQVVEEDRTNGSAFPSDYNGWNDEYEDIFSYEDEMTKVDIYVCSVQHASDFIE